MRPKVHGLPFCTIKFHLISFTLVLMVIQFFLYNIAILHWLWLLYETAGLTATTVRVTADGAAACHDIQQQTAANSNLEVSLVPALRSFLLACPISNSGWRMKHSMQVHGQVCPLHSTTKHQWLKKSKCTGNEQLHSYMGNTVYIFGGGRWVIFFLHIMTVGLNVLIKLFLLLSLLICECFADNRERGISEQNF